MLQDQLQLPNHDIFLVCASPKRCIFLDAVQILNALPEREKSTEYIRNCVTACIFWIPLYMVKSESHSNAESFFNVESNPPNTRSAPQTRIKCNRIFYSRPSPT